VDGSGSVITASDPTASKPSAWKFQVLGSGHDAELNGVDCASSHLCFAWPEYNGVLASTDPTGGQKAWVDQMMDRPGQVNGLACRPGTSKCVAVDDSGNVLTTR
jgi:hypothetical protein